MPAHLPAQPAILPPFDVIYLSSDSESGVNLSNDLDADGGDESNGGEGAVRNGLSADGLEWKEGNRRRGLNGEREINGKGTRDE